MRIHGVDGVDDQVAQDLLDLSFEAQDQAGCAGAPFHFNTGVHETSLIDGERTSDQAFAGDPLRFAGLLVEAQRLVCDDGDATQLAICDIEILPRLGIPGGFTR